MKNNSKKALITGVSGYIGSNLAKSLLGDGWQVGGIIRKDTNLDLLSCAKNNIELSIYDGTVDSLITFIGRHKPDVVFHLASCFIAEHQSDQINDLINSNILFGTHLLEAMKEAGVKKLINTGTAWQHYNNENYNPVCLYAATKEAFEKIIDFYVSAHDLSAITLELFDTYGPNDPRKKIIPLFCKAAQTMEQLLMSPGEQELDLVYIDDILESYKIAYKMILTQEKGRKKYSVATQKPISLKNLAKIFENVLNKKLNIIWGERAYRKREVMNVWDGGTILPNCNALCNLEEGLKKCL